MACKMCGGPLAQPPCYSDSGAVQSVVVNDNTMAIHSHSLVSLNPRKQRWLIITWQENACGERWGKFLEQVTGTNEDAQEIANQYIGLYSPIGIVLDVS